MADYCENDNIQIVTLLPGRVQYDGATRLFIRSPSRDLEVIGCGYPQNQSTIAATRLHRSHQVRIWHRTSVPQIQCAGPGRHPDLTTLPDIEQIGRAHV